MAYEVQLLHDPISTSKEQGKMWDAQHGLSHPAAPAVMGDKALLCSVQTHIELVSVVLCTFAHACSVASFKFDLDPEAMCECAAQIGLHVLAGRGSQCLYPR
eukprot:1151572-Pelagomonas_calceolata.AAC.6